ncbi:MAG: DUF459 domain-containing protein [Acidimicrobiia bacterium]|nr:DUF459 domain-containing protein [Acidimicrobiia bacterium]
MDDPTKDQSQSLHRAQRRKRHRSRFRVAFVSIGGIIVIVAALFATGGPPFTRSTGAETALRQQPAPRPTTTTDPANKIARRALSPEDPLKLWIGGDSLAGALGPTLGEMTAETGVVAPQYDSRPSSGLINPGFFDWEEHAIEQMDELDPEAVVFIVGTNDAVGHNEKKAVEYERQTVRMMRILRGSGRPVLWINVPNMRDEDLERGAIEVNEIHRRAASRFNDVTIVDAHTLFSDENGDYAQRLVDDEGNELSMRASDGIHLSQAGADRLARFTFSLLDEEWNVSEQADPTQPQDVIETKGSGRISGSSEFTSRSTVTPDTTTTTTIENPKTPTSIGVATTTTSVASTTTSTVPPSP